MKTWNENFKKTITNNNNKGMETKETNIGKYNKIVFEIKYKKE